MKLLQRATRPAERLAARPSRISRPQGVYLLALFGALLPNLAQAAEANVVLKFTDADKLYLWASLAFGVLALIVAWFLAKKVLAQSPGSEKMQEVGRAIRDGALAYLRQQFRTMSIFVAILAVGLFFLFNRFGATTAGLIAFCFVLGVLASYVAGYAGMLMAVSANMRTANAALTSYKRALEVAFHAGAVAGMLTVGMGLIGATLILLFAGGDATKLLVGFGFGGSLAALFMRVGGGIFTKAADVGADLVGKVEAGIPEDDPRNPATIADNVGDNVGDCAGMAADIFESYEVTLVAAIVLGAATAAVFDTETWTRLILFALMARGIGIIASIAGIFMVKGSEDIDADPLIPIRGGFQKSAAIAAVLTLILSYFMMGGDGKKPVATTQLRPVAEIQKQEVAEYAALREVMAERANGQLTQAKSLVETTAKAKNKKPEEVTLQDFRTPTGDRVKEAQGITDAAIQRAISKSTEPIKPYEITASDLLYSPELQAKGLKKEQESEIAQSLQPTPESTAPVVSLAGYQRVTDWNAKDIPALSFATQSAPPMPGAPPSGKPFQTIASKFGGKGDDAYIVAQISIKAKIPARPGGPNLPPTPAQDIDRKQWVGPIRKGFLTKQLEQQKTFAAQQKITASFELTEEKPVSLFVGPGNKLALGVPAGVDRPQTLRPAEQLSYYESNVSTIEKISQQAMMGATPPPLETIPLAVIESNVVPWWAFFASIAFGIAMAFAIEALTDYYVSTHKRPTQEVAGVSSAGPAPMIIQGFAYGLESSVFMVFAIVIALLFPLFMFNPVIYGGYILSFYGIALVGLGLLTTTGYILAMDTFGPISDNAQGVYEMSGEGHANERGMKAVSRLDAAGNTTKALTKGFAIATAVVAAVALFHSYLEDAHLGLIGLRLDVPEIFLGLLIGGAAPYLFSAFAINAVGRSSFELINEVRRQFKADPGIIEGTSKPDYGRCVAIVTAAAQRELLGPGILAIALPAAVAFGFSIGKSPTTIDGVKYNLTGAQALGGFLAGAILSGQLMAVLLANSGGMWDNAKKIIEDGLYGGKGSEAHKAGIVCDTVGDPFKDTAGPALNPLIKVMNLVALLLAPIVVLPLGNGVLSAITLVCVVLLAISIYVSKKGSLSQSLQEASGSLEKLAVLEAGQAKSMDATPKKKTLTVEELKDPKDD